MRKGNKQTPIDALPGANEDNRVFHIDVGVINEEDIESYIKKVAARFKKKGKTMELPDYDIKYNFDEDFFI